MIEDPAIIRVMADMETPAFKAGVLRGYWRIESFNFPILKIDVTGTEPDGSSSAYRIRFELSAYPGQAPEARTWDILEDRAISDDRRPKGNPKVQDAFKKWSSDNLYRPWERVTRMHNGFHEKYPHLAWSPNRDLAFILEDIHGLLNINVSQSSVGTVA